MKKEADRLRAVVLARTDYGEAHVIVDFLTRERGRMGGMAKHGRKSRKRFGNALVPGSVVEMAFRPRRAGELVLLESGELLRSFEGLSRDPRLLGLAGLALETVEAFCKPLDPAPEIFDLLLWTLDRFDRAERVEEALLVFHLKLLRAAGFGPNLLRCSVCGRREIEAGRGWGLQIEAGGLACLSCAPGGFEASPGTVKIMALIQSLDLDRIGRVKVGETALGQGAPFLEAYVRHHLGRDLRSARFLEQLARRPPSG
ncbi:MAG: DNA repair protein RecO [Thermodesulfobacteriota bacterium]